MCDNASVIEKPSYETFPAAAIKPISAFRHFMDRLWSNRFGSLYVLFPVFILIATATRAILLIAGFAEIDKSLSALVAIFTTGFLFDSAAFSYFMILPVLYLTLVPDAVFRLKAHRYLYYGIVFFIIALLVFTAFAEYFFWEEFEVRFDFVAVDYLVYQREVTENITESYPLPLLLSAIGIISGLVFMTAKKYLAPSLAGSSTCKKRLFQGCLLLMLPYLSYIYVDPSAERISNNKFNNNLAGNGIYAFFQALQNSSITYDDCYVSRVTADVFRELRTLVKSENAVYADSGGASPHTIQRRMHNSGGSEKRYNVMLVVIESMSAKFLGAFGSADTLTPNMDEIARRGLLFKNLYATGTRTVRGLEAIALSVPPTPGASIVKRPHNENLFSMGTVFRDKGYESKFIYGGYGYFDNMNYFFSHNGFAVIDRQDFSEDEISFGNAWGLCDGDLFNKALREADRSRAGEKNFFQLILTTSNHRPYTYPDGKIDIPSGKGRKGAVKYTDYAIGEFMRRASAKPWFSSTIFVFVADHCARSGSKNSVPVDNYRIPLLVYAPGILPAREIATTASQIDIAPTLFDLLNWEYTSSFFGKPVLRMKKEDERAYISNHLTLGYLQDTTLVVLEPQKKVNSYLVDPETHEETEVEAREEYVNTAIDYYQGAS
ncbi:MAG: sulfatase-like hydrolase/transferase, partial [Pseudomonadota bacterium]